MVARQPQAFQRRINMFVPGCQYAADVIENGPVRFSLGTPATLDPDGILDGADIGTAGSSTAMLLSTAGAIYGQNLTYTRATGSGTGTVTVVGRDYLGQPMKETITMAALVQGKKAFKYVDEVSWTVSTTSTLDLGFGKKLGLPYVVENFLYSYENAVKLERNKDLVSVRIEMTDTSTAATFSGISPVKGEIVGVRSVLSTAITTADCNITWNVNGGSAITSLALLLPFSGSAIGAQVQKFAPTSISDNAVAVGDTINAITDGGGNAGATQLEVLIQPDAGLYTDPVYTDPQTVSTGDPRGLYEPFSTLDGVIEIEVVYNVNRDLNASGRGGLYGMAHFFS